jgi:hypothetical protein
MAFSPVPKKSRTDVQHRLADVLKTLDVSPTVCANYTTAMQADDSVQTVELVREQFLRNPLKRFQRLLSEGASYEDLIEGEEDLAALLHLRSVCVCQKCHGEHNTDGECGDDCRHCCGGDERAECTKCMVCLEVGDPAEWRCSCEDTYLWHTHLLLKKAGRPGRSELNPKFEYDPTDPHDEELSDPFSEV